MHRIVLLVCFAISTMLSVIYLTKGATTLCLAKDHPIDFQLRWMESTRVAAGINPYDVSEYNYRVAQGISELPASLPDQSRIPGTVIGSGYPPWAFLWNAIFIPPIPIWWARSWFAICNLVALVVLCGFAWKSLGNTTILERSYSITALLSASALGNTLGNGQFGIILAALVVLGVVGVHNRNFLPSGFSLALSLLKPTFSFTFAAALLSKRTWQPFVLAASLTLIAAFLTAKYLATDPVTMIRQMLEQSNRWEDLSYSIPDGLIAAGLPRLPVMFVCFGCASLLAWLIPFFRPKDLVFILAAAGVLARVLTYHQLYDNILILFLLFALMKHYFERRETSALIVLTLVLASLWLPGRMTHHLAVQVGQIFIWCTALVWLFQRTRRAPEAHLPCPS